MVITTFISTYPNYFLGMLIIAILIIIWQHLKIKSILKRDETEFNTFIPTTKDKRIVNNENVVNQVEPVVIAPPINTLLNNNITTRQKQQFMSKVKPPSFDEDVMLLINNINNI